MDEAVEDVRKQARQGLVPVLEASRQQVSELVRLVHARQHGAKLRAQLAEHWDGLSSPYAVLEAMRPPPPERRENFAGFFVWATTKTAAAKRDFVTARQVLDGQLELIARVERMNIFLEHERKLARRYLENDAFHDMRHRLQRHLSLREGFVRSEVAPSAPVYMDAAYLSETVEQAIARLKTELEEAHGGLDPIETRVKVAARLLLQRSWRMHEWRRKVMRKRLQSKAQARRVRKSRAVFALRAGMRAEDRNAADIRRAHAAARVIQRGVRSFLRAVKEAIAYAAATAAAASAANARELSGAEMKRLAEERRRDEALKSEMRVEMASQQKLAKWRCERCAQMGAPLRRFKAWQDVQDHLEGHCMLEERRRLVADERRATRVVRLTANLQREEAFLRHLRDVRADHKRKRYVMVLERVGDPAAEFVLDDGKNECGRHHRLDVVVDSLAFPKLVSKRHASIYIMRAAARCPRSEQDDAAKDNDDHGLRAHIVDHGSTNGTSVNGKVVVPGRRVKLAQGDLVVFGACPDNPALRGKSDVVFCVKVRDKLAERRAQ